MNQIKIPAQNLSFFLLIAGFLFCLNLLLVSPALADWAEPEAGCLPGDPGGTCTISAPINVSDTAQTKLGNLTIDGTLDATTLQGTTLQGTTASIENLTVSNDITLFPNAIIDDEVDDELTASKFKPVFSITDQVDLNLDGIEVEGELGSNNINITQLITELSGDFLPITGGTLTGTLNIETDNLPAAETHGIYVPDNSNYGAYLAGDLIGVQGYSAGTAVGEYGGQFTGGYAGVYGSGNTHGVYGDLSGTGAGIYGRNTGTGPGVQGFNTGSGYGAYGYSVTNYGVFGYSSTNNGVYGRTLDNIEYGVKGCYYSGGEQNCGQIGGLQYPGYFNATTASYGSKSCKNGSSCASLGGTDYAGYFEGPVQVTDGSISVTLAEDGWAGQFSDKVKVDEEVIARKFQPTSKNNSIVPYAMGQWVYTYEYNAVPAGIVFDGSYLWIPLPTAIRKYDPRRSAQVTSVAQSGAVTDVIFDGRYVWFSNIPDRSLFRVDTLDDSMIQSGVLPDYHPNALTTDGENIWAAAWNMITPVIDTVFRYDRDGTLLDGESLEDDRISDILFDGEYLWAIGNYSNRIVKIDISDPANIFVSAKYSSDLILDSPERAVFDGKYIWVTDSGDDEVLKISTNGELLETISVGDAPIGIDYDGTYIWVANSGDATLSIINAGDNTVHDTVDIYNATQPTEVYFDGTYINITDLGTKDIIRVFSGTGYGP